jgi:hypothetical protein
MFQNLLLSLADILEFKLHFQTAKFARSRDPAPASSSKRGERGRHEAKDDSDALQQLLINGSMSDKESSKGPGMVHRKRLSVGQYMRNCGQNKIL